MLWAIFSGVRKKERQRFLFFLTLSGLLCVGQTLGLAGSESLLLARLGAAALPLTFIGASALTVLGNFLYAVGVDRARNDVYFIRLLLGATVVLVGLTLACVYGLSWALPVTYCFYYLSLAIFTNHYWTFTGDFFDTLAAKRLFPLFVVGSSLGGMAGGLLVTFSSSFLPPQYLLYFWAFFCLMTALMLRLYRRRLRRWGPLELEEADETSLDGIKAAVRYLRQSALGRWTVLSALAMVLAVFVSQYLYSDVLVQRFPQAEALARFLGIYLAVSNFLEILVEVWLTPFLIRRLGVARANLVHPFLTLLTFIFMYLRWGQLTPAVVARFNRESGENALAAPVRSLVYNALPARFRGRIRAFLEGIVVYSGMTVAGLSLMVLHDRMQPLSLCLAGGLLAGLYMVANLRVRSEYLRTLVTELRAGRLDLAEVGTDIGSERLAELWNALLQEDYQHPSRALLQMAPILAERSVMEPLRQSLNHSDPRLRAACLEALGHTQGTQAIPDLLRGLDDADSSVARAALRAFSPPMVRREEVRSKLRSLMSHADPMLAARAAHLLGPEGRSKLIELVQSSEPGVSAAGLEFLPDDLAALALERLQSNDPVVSASALEALARLRLPVELDLERLGGLQHHSELKVRLAALRCLGAQGSGESLVLVASALGDPALDVRRLAAELLGSVRDEVVTVVEPYLQAHHPATVEAAAMALAGNGSPRSREVLAREFRGRVQEAWRNVIALHVLPEEEEVATRFLRAAYEDAAAKNRKLAFRMLENLESARVIRSVEKVLRFANARTRSDALEVLSNLGDREASSLLVLLLEDGALEDKLPVVTTQVPAYKSSEEVIAEARGSDNQWLRLAAGTGSRAGEPSAREEKMERLLVLRKVPLFAHMTLEQLEAINQLVTEEQYLAGELILREGDVGDELYLLVEGEVAVVKNHGTPAELTLANLSGVSYFGEMAILDDEPRSATVLVTRDARLLALKGDRLKELVLQMPEIAFEIFKVLTSRIRTSDQRLAQKQAAATSSG